MDHALTSYRILYKTLTTQEPGGAKRRRAEHEAAADLPQRAKRYVAARKRCDAAPDDHIEFGHEENKITAFRLTWFDDTIHE